MDDNQPTEAITKKEDRPGPKDAVCYKEKDADPEHRLATSDSDIQTVSAGWQESVDYDDNAAGDEYPPDGAILLFT